MEVYAVKLTKFILVTCILIPFLAFAALLRGFAAIAKPLSRWEAISLFYLQFLATFMQLQTFFFVAIIEITFLAQ